MKKSITYATLIAGVALGSNAHAAIIALEFSTYSTYTRICSSGCQYDYSSQNGSYTMKINTSGVSQASFSDAFGGAENYSERLDTDIYNYESNGADYNRTQGYIDQTYTQQNIFGNLFSNNDTSMNLENYFQYYEYREGEYSGNLEDGITPENASPRRINGNTRIYDYDAGNGTLPFVGEGTDGLLDFFDALIGESFSFNSSGSWRTCGSISSYGSCYNAFGAGDYYTYGTATLVSVSTNPVPVPAAAWLFGSALLSIVGLKRRRQ